jgi:hypothetical protein
MVPPYSLQCIAFQIATYLPENLDDALRVLQMTERLVRFVGETEQPHHLTVVPFPRDEKSASPSEGERTGA